MNSTVSDTVKVAVVLIFTATLVSIVIGTMINSFSLLHLYEDKYDSAVENSTNTQFAAASNSSKGLSGPDLYKVLNVEYAKIRSLTVYNLKTNDDGSIEVDYENGQTINDMQALDSGESNYSKLDKFLEPGAQKCFYRLEYTPKEDSMFDIILTANPETNKGLEGVKLND